MNVLELTNNNFETEALQPEQTVLLDFWATWCGPCKMLAPTLDEIAKENHENVKVCKINIDEEPDLAAQFGVMSIPTLVVMKNGQTISTTVGVRPKQAILQLIDEANQLKV